MTRTYTIRRSRASLALQGLHDMALVAAQAALVHGEASPQAVLAELRSVCSRLHQAGWMRLTRQEVMGRATMRCDG